MYTKKKFYCECFSQCICLFCNVTVFITSSAATTTTTSIVNWFNCFLELIEALIVFITDLCNKDSCFLHYFAASFTFSKICLFIVFVTQLSAVVFSLSIYFLSFSFLAIVNCFFSSIFRHLIVSFTFLINWYSFTVCTFANK